MIKSRNSIFVIGAKDYIHTISQNYCNLRQKIHQKMFVDLLHCSMLICRNVCTPSSDQVAWQLIFQFSFNSNVLFFSFEIFNHEDDLYEWNVNFKLGTNEAFFCCRVDYILFWMIVRQFTAMRHPFATLIEFSTKSQCIIHESSCIEWKWHNIQNDMMCEFSTCRSHLRIFTSFKWMLIKFINFSIFIRSLPYKQFFGCRRNIFESNFWLKRYTLVI